MQFAEKIQETIAKKVEAGELQDASSTIWKMGKASQRAKKEKPNVVLSDEEFEQAATKRGSEDGEKHFCCVNNDGCHGRCGAPLIMDPKQSGR